MSWAGFDKDAFTAADDSYRSTGERNGTELQDAMPRHAFVNENHHATMRPELIESVKVNELFS